jgi:hypothetical protein
VGLRGGRERERAGRERHGDPDAAVHDGDGFLRFFEVVVRSLGTARPPAADALRRAPARART